MPTKTESDIIIFDRKRVAQNRIRAASLFKEHDFLHRWCQAQLSDRLQDVTKSFDTALHIGARQPLNNGHEKIGKNITLDLLPQADAKNYVCGNEEMLPFKAKSLDLVTSNLALHSVNDLPGTLIQIRQALKDDGLFLAALLGGETLHELRQILTETELELLGGVSPRVAPFADKPQMGDLLQRAGFALPVVDSEIITVTYDNVFKLFKDLRGMGESNAIAARNKSPLTKGFFMDVAQRYQNQFAEADGRIIASFEVIFLLGWAPHDSQQKPMRPGTAEHSLAEALGSTEIKTGDKATP